MSTPPTPPTQSLPEPIKIDQAKIEYDRLISYFKLLVWITGGALAIITAVATYFLGQNIRDVNAQAAAAIKTTQDGAMQAISNIGTSAQETAKSQAQKAIDAAFERTNIQKMIETTAQKKVEAAVDAEVQRKLGEKIESFRVLTTKIGQVSIHSAMLTQESRDGLDGLLKDRQDADSTVRDYAASTLKHIGEGYERRLMNRLQQSQDYYLPFFPKLPTKDLMGKIQHFQGPPQAAEEIAKAFLDMKRRVQWDVLVFDIPAAEKWCAAHKPKCDE